jgi:hypothetical protein
LTDEEPPELGEDEWAHMEYTPAPTYQLDSAAPPETSELMAARLAELNELLHECRSFWQAAAPLQNRAQLVQLANKFPASYAALAEEEPPSLESVEPSDHAYMEAPEFRRSESDVGGSARKQIARRGSDLARDTERVHPGVIARIADMERNFKMLERSHSMTVGEFQDLLDVLKIELDEERTAHAQVRKRE